MKQLMIVFEWNNFQSKFYDDGYDRADLFYWQPDVPNSCPELIAPNQVVLPLPLRDSFKSVLCLCNLSIKSTEVKGFI